MYEKSESLEIYIIMTFIIEYFLLLMSRCSHPGISCPWRGAVWWRYQRLRYPAGKEAPGTILDDTLINCRGNNWVIAETASKIPSDQAAPGGARQFTAREFRGREGDAVRYTAPEGHKVIEETWVHPPELETGARDTGQSWPLELGDEGPDKPSHTHTISKSGKRKSPRKGQISQAIPAEKVDELDRRV